ncbi:MAG: hypothetical protein UV46_C0038G0002 [Candidatus Gottesmanbacteria bacterium GW2011_GWC2_42_8]|nr:MAG: hypothetical protein UV46_C0038G0002 [Candidatus Gottesmanbacteria bacterium GW2011_GWC2_42_8]
MGTKDKSRGDGEESACKETHDEDPVRLESVSEKDPRETETGNQPEQDIKDRCVGPCIGEAPEQESVKGSGDGYRQKRCGKRGSKSDKEESHLSCERNDWGSGIASDHRIGNKTSCESQEGTMLFDTDGCSEHEAAEDERKRSPVVSEPQEGKESGKGEEHDEMFRVRPEPLDAVAQREQGKCSTCRKSHPSVHKGLPDEVDQADRGGVDEKQSEVNRLKSLSEDRKDDRVSEIDSGELHVVRFGVGGDSLQDQLRHGGILPLIPLQGNIEEAQPDGGGEDNHANEEEKRGVGGKRLECPGCFAHREFLDLSCSGMLKDPCPGC